MDKFFLLKLAFKNLWMHKLRTFLTIGGILVGIAAIVFLISFAFGLEKIVTEQVSQGDAFKLIDVGTGNSDIVFLNNDSVKLIQDLPNVREVQLVINAGAKAKNNGGTTDVAFYSTSNQYLEWSGIRPIVGNSFSEEKSAREILVNTSYLKIFGDDKPESFLDKEVIFDIILSKETTPNKKPKILKDQKFKIVGVFQNTNPASVYANYNQLAADTGYIFSQAKVEVVNKNEIDTTRKQIENLGFKTQYVGDTVNQINEVFAIFKIILGGFGLIAMIVAALGMLNTLTISLLERMREVALMKMLGMMRKDIRRLFITEALILGFVGGGLGLIIGNVIAKIINSLFNTFAMQAGGEALNIFYLPWWFAVLAVLFSLFVAFTTGLYPSYRASRVNVLDVMRYE
ncbi:MAG: ABC transporter permease [Patescibacteria group bacterium]|nr:ABC transporter permease [Patescibacteria group bacterium]